MVVDFVKKRLTAMFLVLSVLFSFTIPVMAEQTEKASNTQKNIIMSEDFSSASTTNWRFSNKNNAYILNQKLNINAGTEAAKAISNAITIQNGELDFTVNIKEAGSLEVLLRYVDENSFYSLRLYESGKAILAKKVKGGSFKEIAKGNFTFKKGAESKLHITLIGNEIKVCIDDISVLSAEDSSIKSGSLGFGGTRLKAVIDNIEYYKNAGVDYDPTDSENIVETRKIYVSVDGNDKTGNGSEENPYASIEKAKTVASRLKRGRTPVDVIFKEGVYRLESTLVFTDADSGTKGAPVRYVAEEGAEVIFSGAKPVDVTKFEPVSGEMKERLRPEVNDRVLQLDLQSQGFKSSVYDFTQPGQYVVGQRVKPLNVTLNHKLQNIARWPNSGYEVITDCDNTNPPKLFYTSNEPTRWAKAKNFFIDGYLVHDWAPEWALVDSVDVYKNAINLKNKTSYGIKVGGKWAAVNLLEELDVPGEWYIDFDTMTMYYYPPHELTENDLLEIAHVGGYLVRLDGVSHIEMEGIHFTMTRTGGGCGVVATNGANNILIKDCIVDNVTRHGIEINGNDITIDNCIINNTGESGIAANNCGNPETLEDSNVVIKNCDISNPSIYAGGNGTAAITTGEKSVGVVAINNVLHNCTNSAIRYHGIGHRFAYNEIYNCVNEASDAGAVYSGRNWTYYGNVIEYNFFHDLGQKLNTTAYLAASMFWDDYNNGGEFSHNISVINNKDKSTGVIIGGGSDNIVMGNTFVASVNDITAQDRLTQDWNKYAYANLRYDLVPVQSEPYKKKYPKMTTILQRIEENGGELKRENIITDNFSVDCTENSNITEVMRRDGEIARNVQIGEDYDVFVNPDDLDYRVKKSAKEKYGISDEVLDEDFDINSIGIQGNPEMDMSRMEFITTYPENQDNTINRERAVLAWTTAPMADMYTYIVAEDPEFNNVVIKEQTLKTSTKLTGLERGKTYHWKVIAHNTSRQYGCDIEAKNGAMCFTVAEKTYIDKSGLELSVSNAEKVVKTFKEGTNPGDYRIGSVASLKQKIKKGKTYLKKDVSEQSEIDEVSYDINKSLTNIEGYINPGYTTLNLTKNSPWVTNQPAATTVTQEDGSVKIDITKQVEISLAETLSNYNVMCFKTKVDNFDNKAWFAYGLRALSTDQAIYFQDAYYILIKEDIFELQKQGVIYKTAPNNGKFVAGKWHDLQFGSITTENGINMYFKLDGEVIFDYLDKTNPQKRPGMFAMYFASDNNSVEIKQADYVPDGLYEFSDAIIREVNSDFATGGMLTVEDAGYGEKGKWSDKAGMTGENNSKVRTSDSVGATATWDMNAGSAGNGKVYKVSYYHIPSANGDKNVKVKVHGYGGEYETTIDLSSGQEGYIDLGVFKFIAADYIGRLSVTFTASGEGEVNVSNIKYELADDQSDMLE